MKLGKEIRIRAPRSVVWDALNDTEVLQACIPGCEQLERLSENELRTVVTTTIGPMRARFNGTVLLTNIQPLEGYTLTGKVQGGAVGFAQGAADVTLQDAGDCDTVLRYDVSSTIGGKLAQLGSRLVEGTALKLADQFFSCFERVLGERQEGIGTSTDTASSTEKDVPQV